MHSIHMERKRGDERTAKEVKKRKQRRKRKTVGQSSLSRDFSATSVITGPSRPSSARELVESTGISYEDLFDILTERQRPHLRQQTTSKTFDLSEFTPISYTRRKRGASPRKKSPVRKRRRSRKRKSNIRNRSEGYSGFEEESKLSSRDFPVFDEEDSDFLDDDEVDEDDMNERRLVREEKYLSRTRPATTQSQRSKNLSRMKHLVPDSHSHLLDSEEYSPDDLVEILARDRKKNEKSGKMRPFLRHFGSQKEFEYIREKNDPQIQRKNRAIQDKVYEIKKQDAYERKMLNEVKTHLRREKIRSSFRAQQQNNLIKHLETYYDVSPRSSFQSSARPEQRMKKKVVDNFLKSISHHRSFDSSMRPSTSPGRYRQQRTRHSTLSSYSGRRGPRRGSRGSVGSSTYSTRATFQSEDDLDEFVPEAESKSRQRKASYQKPRKRVTLASTHFMRKEIEKRKKKEREARSRKKKRYEKLYKETMSEIREFEKRKRRQMVVMEEDVEVKGMTKVVGRTKYYM